MLAGCRAAGAREVRLARDEAERLKLWKGRKQAFGALGRLAPNYYTHDGVIPRTRLPEVLAEIARIAERHQVTIANVFHAGDGNLHPVVLYDERAAGRARAGEGGRRRASCELVIVGGRRALGRARHRPREDRLHGPAVRRGRPGRDAPAARRLQPARAVQPRQGDPRARAAASSRAPAAGASCRWVTDAGHAPPPAFARRHLGGPGQRGGAGARWCASAAARRPAAALSRATAPSGTTGRRAPERARRAVAAPADRR